MTGTLTAWEQAQRRRVRMIAAAVPTGAPLPTAPLQLYRGCNPATVRGIFWTTSLFEASGYADLNRVRGHEPTIARAVVPASAAIARRVTLRWSIWIAKGIPHPSSEIQIDPGALADITVDLAPVPDVPALRQIGRLPASERDAALTVQVTGFTRYVSESTLNAC